MLSVLLHIVLMISGKIVLNKLIYVLFPVFDNFRN